MKRITELLERLNNAKNHTHKFVIHSDSSGSIREDASHLWVLDFLDHKDMCRKLDKLDASLTETKPNDWTL
jgi:hypothetical protein